MSETEKKIPFNKTELTGVDTNVGLNKETTSHGTIKTINETCKVQLTESEYKNLSAKLKAEVIKNNNKYKQEEEKKLSEQKKTLKTNINNVKTDLDNLKTTLTEIVGKFNALYNLDTEINSITRENQSSVTEKINNVKEELKRAKNELDKANGSLVSKGVFGEVDKTINSIKKDKVDKIKSTRTIELGSIKGKLYTSGFRITDRNLDGVDCELVSVDVKDKIYTVKYNGKTLKVKQSDVCLVNADN